MFIIRKKYFLVILFLSSITLLKAETGHKTYSINITPITGILIGKSKEHLYKYPGKDQFISELQWDLKPILYFGLEADFGPAEPFQKSGIIAAASVKFGLPVKTGKIEDSDWLDSNHDYLTHYSQHDAYLQNAILLDILTGYSLFINDFLALSAFGEFSYMYFSWMAENGFYQYANGSYGSYSSWDNSIPKKPIYGAGIRYIQNWFIFSPGISAKGKLGSLFTLEGTIKYSPLVYCSDRDDHLLVGRINFDRQRLFFGNFYFGRYINGDLHFTYKPVNNMDFFLSLSYRYITGLRDKSFFAYTGTGVNGNHFENYEGGTGYSAFEVKAGVRIRVYGRN